MNTPAHVILNLALATGGERKVLARPVLFGALLPDLPMLLFFLFERGVVGTPSNVLWGETYFQAGWQDFFDVFNSIPLALLALAAAHQRGNRAGVAFCASMILHHLLDLPLHHDDAHRHFFPFSEMRFVSPVSYWDPRHYGTVAAFAETVAVLVGAFVLARRFASRGVRVALLGCVLLYAFVFVGFYGFGFLPAP